MGWLQKATITLPLFSVGLVASMSLATPMPPQISASPLNTEVAPPANDGTIPKVRTTSGTAEIALARHLRAIGAKMYGAYWCPHCHEQMNLFGEAAARQLAYIECAEDGKNSQMELCRRTGIQAFPTWKIRGKTYEGTQSLADLAKASGYRGAQNFKYSLP